MYQALQETLVALLTKGYSKFSDSSNSDPNLNPTPH